MVFMTVPFVSRHAGMYERPPIYLTTWHVRAREKISFGCFEFVGREVTVPVRSVLIWNYILYSYSVYHNYGSRKCQGRQRWGETPPPNIFNAYSRINKCRHLLYIFFCCTSANGYDNIRLVYPMRELGLTRCHAYTTRLRNE